MREALRPTARRLLRRSGRRRAAGVLGAIGAIALAVGVTIGAGLPGSSKGASRPAKASGAATVQRRDLIATDTVSGTLSYANQQTVYNRVSGTITALPSIGAVITRGQTLYKVDNAPVVLFDGAVPAYRDLSEGVSDGPDVQELEQNLVALGFDPDHQITINQTFDAATTAAVERWQASLGETQTGTAMLGQIVFLPGPQRITAVDTVLGSTGSGSSASGGSTAASGSASPASTTVSARGPEFVSLTTTSTSFQSSVVGSRCGGSAGRSSTNPGTQTTPPKCAQQGSGSGASGTGSAKSKGGKPGGSSNTQLQALIALLKAETAELKGQGRSSSGSAAGGSSGRAGAGATSFSTAGRGGGGGGSSGAGASAGRGAPAGGGASAGSGAGGGASAGSGASAGGGASASGASAGSTVQPILQTTSTQLVVSVQLDATKQSEAVFGEPVTVQMPDGSTVDGKVTRVSPVAQTSPSSGSSSSSGAGGSAGSSSAPSATIPVTITLAGHRPATGLDQAAVSVNFEQQRAANVLSVPVTALLATAGGGYAVQEAQAPHQLIPVTPGLFAAGYVQVSGAGIYPGLQVTNSQG